MKTEELFIDCDKLPNTLSKNELYQLFNKMNQGDESARELLVKHNIRLVLYEVRAKFSLVDYDKKDLVAVGNIGLLKAINSFDISKNIKFATFASHCIDNEILMFLRKIKRHYNVGSIYDIIKKDKEGYGLKVEDTIIDDINIENECINNETNQIIRNLVNELPYRDREIIMMFFGFYNNHRYWQEEIAQKFNLSQSHVSRIITKTLKKLASKLKEEGIIEETNKLNKQKIKK